MVKTGTNEIILFSICRGTLIRHSGGFLNELEKKKNFLNLPTELKRCANFHTLFYRGRQNRINFGFPFFLGTFIGLFVFILF